MPMHYAQPPAPLGFGGRIKQFLGGPTALPFAAGLLGGGSNSRALSRGFGNAAQARIMARPDEREERQGDATAEFYEKNNRPDLAALARSGAGQLASQIYNKGKDKGTSLMQNYEFAQGQGFEGNIFDYQRQLKEAGSTRIINNLGPSGIDYGKPESGLAWERDSEGMVKLDERGVPIGVPYQGGSIYAGQQAATKKEQAGRVIEERTAGIVAEDVDRALKIIADNPKMTTGFGSLLSSIPGTPSHDVAELIKTVKANAGFDKLQAMREASPTGGALGQVSERELAFLQATIGSLEQTQRRGQLEYNLKRVKETYLRIINEGISDDEIERMMNEMSGPSEEDIQHTMKIHGMTREQVLERLNAR